MADRDQAPTSMYQRIYNVVRQVPPGKVTTYGQIAKIAGCTAREVGYAMAGLHDDSVPWQRVVNAEGKISIRGVGGSMQRQFLEDEGVRFDEHNRINMEEFGWLGPWG